MPYEPDATVGIYDRLPAYPNTKARKMFIQRLNQQDGVAMILKYCQTPSGFTFGSKDTANLRRIPKDKFSGIAEF
ncbi:hypothetical protein CPB97_002267 [Podila verticillata]|nr:hypothetical protein CPB97_002267 [Podila verticillata]